MPTMITIWNMSPPPGAALVCAQALLINKDFPPVAEMRAGLRPRPKKVRILARRCTQSAKLRHETGELSPLDRATQFPHQFQKVIEVVPGIEPRAENFVHLLKMVQIRAAEVTAGVASTRFIERPQVVPVAGVPELDRAMAREDPAVARVAGGQHAIEHIDACGDRFDDILGRADTHQVTRFIGRKPRSDVREHALHVGLGLTDRQSADRIAVEAYRDEAGERAVAKTLVHSALDDPEQCVARLGRVPSLEFAFAALRPPQGKLHRLARAL